MVNVCEMFGREHCVTFNVAKSYAISYGPSIPPNHNIHMNGNPIPKTTCGSHRKPKWTECVKPLKQDSVFWHRVWKDAGRPALGVLADIMRRTRALYHRAVQVLKQEEDDNRKAKLAECISKNNDRNLWEELRKIKGKNKVGSPIIDDATYPEDITKIFSNKYRKLYSSAPTKVETLNDIRQKLAYRLKGEVWGNHRVEISNTVEAIKKLNKNKNDGMLGTNSNHFIYGSEKLCGHLTCLLNMMFSHGHTAEDLLTSIIISIPKNYNASLRNSEN